MQDRMEKRQKNRIILSYRYSDTQFRRKKVGSSQVKIEYIYHNTNIHSIQGNTDIFKVIVSIYNQFLFNVVFRQVL